MKFLALTTAVLAASASAFAPSSASSRATTSLNAEKSQALPFMNKPALVRTSTSTFDCSSWATPFASGIVVLFDQNNTHKSLIFFV